MKYQDLINALNAADKRPCDLECPGSGECPTVGCLFREAADAIEELEAAVSGYEAATDVEFVKEDGHERIRFVPKWIPVTERLPEDTYPVLVTYLGYNDLLPKSDMVAMLNDGDWYWYDDESKCKVVITHWMPLPTPPKEETE